MRSILRLAALVLAGLSVPLAVATAAPAPGGVSDVSITIAYVGHGPAKAKVGQDVRLNVTVTNLGSATATGVELMSGGTDHFDPVSITVPGVTPGDAGDLKVGDLASGASISATVVLRVVAFPVGESRSASVGVRVSTWSDDANEDNNSASVSVRIIGGHGFA